MVSVDEHDWVTGAGVAEFQSTHWSVVLKANQETSPQMEEALGKLCQSYWYPVYAFIRRRGHDPDQAKDLTQDFFALLLEKHYLQVVNREKGRFRSFLLACVQHFLGHEREKERALKRGGRCSFVSLDDDTAELWYAEEPADRMSPEVLFDRRWAMTLLGQAVARLRQEYTEAGKAAQYEGLQGFLSGARNGPASYAEVAAGLETSEGALRQAVHRMRQRFAELLRSEVAQTVATPMEVEGEMAYLRLVLSC
jgi:RNA polymerase sigma factor (sigma-70 family)